MTEYQTGESGGFASLVVYLFGQFISMLGDQIAFFAIAWWAGVSNQSPALLGTFMASSTLPRAVFFLFGGWLGDRWGSLRLVIIADLLRLSASFFIVYAALQGHTTLAWFAPPLALIGAASGLYYPARSAIIPFLAGTNLLRANQGMALGERLSLVVGPLLGAAMVGAVGLAGAYAINAVTFAVSAGTAGWIMLRSPSKPSLPVTRAAPSLSTASWHIVLEIPLLWVLLPLSFIAAGALNAVFTVGLPTLVLKFNASSTFLGSLISAFGGGAIVGTLFSHRLRISPFKVITGGYIVTGLLLISLPWFDMTLFALSGVLLIGIISGMQTVWSRTLLQGATPGYAMTRVMSLSFVASMGGSALWLIAVGVIGELLQADGLFLIMGIIITGAGVIGLVAFPYVISMGKSKGAGEDG